MRRGDARGFTLVAMLLVVALVALGLATAAPIWSQQLQRERERELMHLGVLHAQALASYQRSSPGSEKRYPETLQALLLDTRFVGTVRHLRKAYPDPVNRAQAWGLVRDVSGRIVGVYSLSDEMPLAQGAVRLDDRLLPPARRYSDWKFLADPRT